MLAGFHIGGGLYFERLGDGSVLIKREHPPGSGQVVMRNVLLASEWASVVASMTLEGETGETYQRALDQHMRVRP